MIDDQCRDFFSIYPTVRLPVRARVTVRKAVSKQNTVEGAAVGP